jgi:hypothetical protein
MRPVNNMDICMGLEMAKRQLKRKPTDEPASALLEPLRYWR